MRGLVSRHNSENQNVILPIWHGITKEEVSDFSPSLCDLIAIDTSRLEALEIALKLLNRIRPEIYQKYDRAYLQKIANGQAMNDLQIEIEEKREELEAAEKELVQYNALTVRLNYYRGTTHP